MVTKPTAVWCNSLNRSMAVQNSVDPHAPGTLLRKIFDAVDTDESGCISKEELTAALASMNLDTAKVRAVLRETDEDGNGEIDLDEFARTMEKTLDSLSLTHSKVHTFGFLSQQPWPVCCKQFLSPPLAKKMFDSFVEHARLL